MSKSESKGRSKGKLKDKDPFPIWSSKLALNKDRKSKEAGSETCTWR
jgi:hypothetical protein